MACATIPPVDEEENTGAKQKHLDNDFYAMIMVIGVIVIAMTIFSMIIIPTIIIATIIMLTSSPALIAATSTRRGARDVGAAVSGDGDEEEDDFDDDYGIGNNLNDGASGDERGC